MKMKRKLLNETLCHSYATNPCLWIFLLILNLGFVNHVSAQTNYDLNGDGTLNILVIGTNNSINGGEAFSPDQITTELQSILDADASISTAVNVVAEDIYMSKPVLLGLGGSGTEYTWTHYSHSLLQYYYWPEGHEDRLNHLSGNGGVDWDFVVIGADPYFVSNLPGYYSLGVNKIASKVEEGDAQPLLLMMWPKNEATGASIEHYEEFTYRTADGAKASLPAIPAGLAWDALPAGKKDVSSMHPTPNGAYVAAASIYTHIFDRNAASSNYTYDDAIAEVARNTVVEQATEAHYSGIRTFMSPYKSCDIGDETLYYKHTGSSSENGILGGLNWVFNQSPKSLSNGGTSPISFNYGRANTNFEANKRYVIDPSLYDFSFGFPMQDHGNHGNTSMLYGLDRRQSGTLNDTDVGTARYMIEQSELPYGRAVPIRTLFAQMHEAIPGQSAYRDSWHMHRDLDKAIGAYMFTLLNGTCALGEEPVDPDSDEWRTWMSHKIGYETAWNFMYLEGSAPACSTLSDADGDGFNSYVDCNDDDPAINPNAQEIPDNGIDEDCVGGDLTTVATHELDRTIISIFPNPATDIIYINVDSPMNAQMRLYDLYGRVIRTSINVNQIDVASIPSGNYFLEVKDLNTGESIMEMIVVGR